jgi:NUMOD3 motif
VQQLVDRSGENNPMYGKVPANAFQSGPLHPMYGKFGITPTNAMTVNVYSLDNQLVRSFSSQVACAKWLDVSEGTVRLYVKSGKVFRKQYLIVRSL